MPKVAFARHLYRFFPDLEGKDVAVEAKTAAEVVQKLEELAPGFAFYICDETGQMRPHVNIFIENELIVDRKQLSDHVAPDSTVYIMQALSGG
ncbi:MAG: ubiquitin family protein [Planctomycetota bacterium]|jgi:molybdopterin synthase sulfur carrier subunit